MINQPHILYWILGGVAYIGGCLVYISRFPERKFPGIFDYMGSSHNIWHIMVFVGITLHHYASVDTYYDRLNNQCPV
jgi:adiponectin receptor